MSHARAVAPRHRRQRASVKPSAAEVSFPIGDFLLPPTDALGRFVNIAIQAAPQVRRSAAKMVAKSEFGFETEQDVMRWAVTYGLEELGRRSENHEITGDVALLVSWNNLAKEELEKQYYMVAIDTQTTVIHALIRGGNIDKALHHAETLWQQHDRIENPYWRSVYRERYKALLDHVRQRKLMMNRASRRANARPERRKHARLGRM